MDVLHQSPKQTGLLCQGTAARAAEPDANETEKPLSQCRFHLAVASACRSIEVDARRKACQACSHRLQSLHALRYKARRCYDPHGGTIVRLTTPSPNGASAMSTKFSGHGKLHKPPAVCKTPPPSRVIPAPPHQEQSFQGYASWYDTEVSDWVAVTGPLQMIPIGNGRQWNGITPEAEIQLQLLMTWSHPLARHRYDLTRFRNGMPEETVSILASDDRQFDPFDSGLLLFPGDSPSIAIQARVNY